MDTEGLKLQFIKQRLDEGVRRIFRAQLAIATGKIYGSTKMPEAVRRRRTGTLREALESPRYLVADRPYGVTVQTDWPMYIRFLDMKKHGNYKIYNRQVWGILYRETFNDMRYECRQWIERAVASMLSAGLEG